MKRKAHRPPLDSERMPCRFTVRMGLELYEWVRVKGSGWLREALRAIKKEEENHTAKRS